MGNKDSLPDIISEEYYQISPAILDSFPRYRPPLDLFVLNTKIMQLETYSKKGMRLTNEQVEEMHNLCAGGDLFVSRADHPVYSQHIVKQLDLVLVDQNLKAHEVTSICLKALEADAANFFDQPVKIVFDGLYNDLMVTTEYIWQDKHRIKMFMRRLHRGDHSLALHSVNTLCIGLWLLIQSKADDLRRKELDNAALALLLHDVGMAKVPPFILSKTTPLKPEEKEKILPHTLAGYKIVHKLDLTFDVMRQAVLEHHERLDGSGYPQHSKDISSFGRLAAVADAFSAMIQKRPYAEAKDPLAACRELAADKTRFDLTYSGILLAALLSESFGKFT